MILWARGLDQGLAMPGRNLPRGKESATDAMVAHREVHWLVLAPWTLNLCNVCDCRVAKLHYVKLTSSPTRKESCTTRQAPIGSVGQLSWQLFAQ
jgi:hypothetical protein